MSNNPFLEVGTDPGDLNDHEDPCLAAGIGGYIVPESVEILEACQDPNSLNIIYIRATVRGVFTYTPILEITYYDEHNNPTTIDASSRLITNYHNAEDSLKSVPFSTSCSSETILMAWDVGTLISNYSSVVSLDLKLTLLGTFQSEEFDDDLIEAANIFESSNPSAQITYQKGLTPQPHALFFDEATGQLKLQFSNLSSTSCTCNINCVDVTIENEELVPCSDEIQEVTVNSTALIGNPSDINISISDSLGNNTNLKYYVLLGVTPLPPIATRKSNPDRIEITPQFLTTDFTKIKKSKVSYQIWRYENNSKSKKLIVDWTTKPFDLYVDRSISPGSTYGYSIRFRGSFNTVSGFSSNSSGVTVPGPRDRNVVLFLLDDVGFDMLKAYNDETPFDSTSIKLAPGSGLYPHTPIINYVAKNGITFTSARAMPVCSPTRSNIQGGQYCFRNGVGTVVKTNYCSEDFNEWGVNGYSGKNWDQYSLGSIVQSGGSHSSVLIGKWHLALPTGEQGWGAGGEETGPYGYGPRHVIDIGGYNETYTTFRNLNQPPLPLGDYYDYYEYYANDIATGYTETYHYLDTTTASEAQKEQIYTTARNMDTLISWVNAKGPNENFVAVVPLNTIHSPYAPFPPEGLVNSPEAIAHKDVNAFYNIAAKLEAFDSKLYDFLRLTDRSTLAKTNIIIMGDNGSPDEYWSYAETSPAFRDIGAVWSHLVSTGGRFKHGVFEPGIRVPLIIMGPDVNTNNRDYPYMVDAVDIYPTIMDMIGVDYSNYMPSNYNIDGISFFSAITGGLGATATRNTSYSEMFEPCGVWSGSYITSRKQGYISLLQGTGLDGNNFIASGWFKLIRHYDGTGNYDYMYQLKDEHLVDVDPWELAPLGTGNGDPYYQQYLKLNRGLSDLLGM